MKIRKDLKRMSACMQMVKNPLKQGTKVKVDEDPSVTVPTAKATKEPNTAASNKLLRRFFSEHPTSSITEGGPLLEAITAGDEKEYNSLMLSRSGFTTPTNL